MATTPVLKVAVNVPLSRLFDYLPPAAGACPVPGSRVRVPFGRRNEVGLVMDLADGSDLPPSKIRRATGTLDREPLLGGDDLWLIRFTADYYHHPVGEVAAAGMPTLLRHGRTLDPVLEHVAATDAGLQVDIEALARKAPRQAELIEALVDAGGNGLDVDTLNELIPHWRRACKALAEKGLITRFDAKVELQVLPQASPTEPGPVLNDEQAAALAGVRTIDGFGACVLDGVTGSGKTEIYLRLIEDMLARRRQVLVLVPEIGLTPQLVSRFRRRLGVEPALLHSGLSDRERLAAWRLARSGDAQLVVGTRSAVFTPLPNAGLVIVDEEHDHSLKQHEGLRYSARDLAIARAKHMDIPIVLGSATPTLEMLQHCESGRYRHLILPRRAGSAEPPVIRLIDLGRATPVEGISEPLASAIDRHLGDGGQALLFLNRRGFAPTLICMACGHVAECSRCDSRLTVHASERRLRCHHCGAARALDESCGECGEPMRPLGEGTQRLEDALRQRFAGRTILRIDSDSTQRRGAMDAVLEQAALGKADILVGTQMLSKGHHFPLLTLVGIVNADQGLFGTDFRSEERLAQSVVQVAGRAGRESRIGEVLIQTAFPTHLFWQRLIDSGYPGVARKALEERRAAHWPPFSRLALIRAAAHKKKDAHAILDAAARRVGETAADRVRALGPVDAPMARRAGRYRAQLLLQSTDRRALHEVLADLRPMLESEPAGRKSRWSIDVDPVELF